MTRSLLAGLPLALALLLTSGPRTVAAPTPGAQQAVIAVKGLACPFCVFGLEKHLSAVPGVEKVEVDLKKARPSSTSAPAPRSAKSSSGRP